MSSAANTNSTSMAGQHKLKREKLLMCDYNTLSQHDVKCLVQYCSQSDSGIVERVLLASLFTGRSFEDLARNDVEIRYIAGADFGALFSSMSFPKWNKKCSEDKAASSGNLRPFVILPRDIIESLEAASGQSTEVLTEEAIELLKTLNRATQSRLTLSRIKQYIKMHAAKCSLTQAEVHWISNTPLKEHGGSSYLSISGAELAQKHYPFINALMKIAQLPQFEIESVLNNRIMLPAMGSNFRVPELTIKIAIEKLKKTIKNLQRFDTQDHWKLFNCYTYYTVIMLNMCTGHRPSRKYYGKLENFDLSRRVVLINDKENRESTRVLPLNDSVFIQFKFYLAFLEAFVTKIQYIYPTEADILRRTLKGETGLFHLWINTSLKPFSHSAAMSSDIPTIKARGNWNRHWIRSALALWVDIKPPAIDAYMGHENLLDESFSSYSSLDMSDMRQIADALNDELELMSVSPLEVTI